MTTKLETKLDDAMKTIEILTTRLIDLANLENKLIEREHRVSKKLAECHAIHQSVLKIEESVRHNMEINKCFFNFRFKWMDSLFHKRRSWL